MSSGWWWLDNVHKSETNKKQRRREFSLVSSSSVAVNEKMISSCRAFEWCDVSISLRIWFLRWFSGALNLILNLLNFTVLPIYITRLLSRSVIFLLALNLSRSLITRQCCDKVSSCRRWHSSGKLPSTQPSAQFIILAFWWCLMWMILKAIYLHNSHFNLLDCADPALTFASTVALPVAASNPAVAISKQRRFNELSSALLELNLIWCTGSPLRAFHPSVTRTSSLIIATSLIKPPTAFA